MLEIRQRYVLDDAGLPIAIQIPIAQFERLLEMLRDPNSVTLLQDHEDLRDGVAIGLKALEEGRYTDYDAESLVGLFDGIKRKGRSLRGIEV